MHTRFFPPLLRHWIKTTNCIQIAPSIVSTNHVDQIIQNTSTMIGAGWIVGVRQKKPSIGSTRKLYSLNFLFINNSMSVQILKSVDSKRNFNCYIMIFDKLILRLINLASKVSTKFVGDPELHPLMAKMTSCGTLGLANLWLAHAQNFCEMQKSFTNHCNFRTIIQNNLGILNSGPIP